LYVKRGGERWLFAYRLALTLAEILFGATVLAVPASATTLPRSVSLGFIPAPRLQDAASPATHGKRIRANACCVGMLVNLTGSVAKTRKRHPALACCCAAAACAVVM